MNILFFIFAKKKKNNIKVISVKPAAIKTPIWNKSVKSTRESFENINEIAKEKYLKELFFLEKNALENNNKGIEIYVVVDKIIEIINAKNPKSTYNVGIQAVLADVISKFPQDFINRLIKFRLGKI